MKRIFAFVLIVGSYLNGFSQKTPIIVDTITANDVNKEAYKNLEIYISPKDNDTSFMFVDENATFQGGDINDFKNYIQKKLIYPESSKKKGIQGKVIIQFSVNYDGSVFDAMILRGINNELNDEALRCINSSPKWKPAKQGTKIVRQRFAIPVVFKLK